MRYIKIRAASYNEAMMKLKMDHGEDAIPISHKYVREGGVFNTRLFSKEVVELTAAVQEKKFKSSAAPSKKIDFTVGDSVTDKRKSGLNMESSASGALYDKDKEKDMDQEKDQAADRVADFKMRLLDDAEDTAKFGGIVIPKLDRESVMNGNETPGRDQVAEERKHAAGFMTEPEEIEIEYRGRNRSGGEPLKSFEKEFDEIKRAINRIVTDQMQTGSGGSSEDLLIREYREILEENDFDQEQCNSMINRMKNTISKEDLKDKYKIEKSLKDLLMGRIVTTGPIEKGNRKKIVMFVGPTGVGKTTTMAKLGAIYSLRESNRVAFITIDNYRIAATEQLKKYAEIMGIPVYPVNTHKEFTDILEQDRADIIMIDTSGRSHRNDIKISEIKGYADMVDYDLEKILCVSANIKKRDLNEIFRAFDILHFDSIIITKVDETSSVGNVIDIADKYNKPISYFTNGQEVPNDIVVAEPERIVDMMLGIEKM